MLSLGSAVADLIYPPRCAWCQQDLPTTDHVGICLDCRSRLAAASEGWCRRCGAPIGVAAQVETCGHCHGKSFPWERAIALGPYRGELSEAIVRTKRPKNEPLVFALGRLLAAERSNELNDLQADAVVPMPMHWLRRVRRG